VSVYIASFNVNIKVNGATIIQFIGIKVNARLYQYFISHSFIFLLIFWLILDSASLWYRRRKVS
jgi:hypothetical protein